MTLAGYGRDWAFPGAVGEDTSKVGVGHVFKSTDAGETFTDVSGDLPDAPASWSVLHNGHLVIGTDTGVYESCDNAGGAYSVLGGGLPTAPISTLRLKPGDPDLLVAATYGRGIYTYRFGDDSGRCARRSARPRGSGKPCATAAGFRRANGDAAQARPALRGEPPREAPIRRRRLPRLARAPRAGQPPDRALHQARRAASAGAGAAPRTASTSLASC